MSTATSTSLATTKAAIPAIAQPRLPYHPGLKERFGIDQTEWRALVESTFPSARSVGAVILALAYCKARNLDPFKKTVHIVPIWDKERGCEVETVWPGIAEYRTTACRTGVYAGHDECAHGPVASQTWDDVDKYGKSHGLVVVSFPEWSQMTVYRMVQGQRCAFPGPRVYWLETYSAKRNDCPNMMWADRPIGMLDKCAEAAALRGAFPEEIGGEPSYEEWGGFRWHGRGAIDVMATPAKTEPATLDTMLPPAIAAEVGSQSAGPSIPEEAPDTEPTSEVAASPDDLPQGPSDSSVWCEELRAQVAEDVGHAQLDEETKKIKVALADGMISLKQSAECQVIVDARRAQIAAPKRGPGRQQRSMVPNE